MRRQFTGDILFSGAHPIAWAGPVSNWIAACERILAMDIEVIVPGHGPIAEKAAVGELKAYRASGSSSTSNRSSASSTERPSR